MNDDLYNYIHIPLGQEHRENADSTLGPYQLLTKRNFIYVMSLDGTASLAFSEDGQGNFFPLRQGMKIRMSGKRKKILIVNEAQAGKNLYIFLGRQRDAEIR